MAVMKQFHINRLTKLRDFLKTVPNTKFDLTNFYKVDKCGTVACACGWAATIPAFKKAGLKLNKVGLLKVFGINYRNETNSTDAAELFFGIDDLKFEYLFTCEGYKQPTRHNVIRRLTSFINQKQNQLNKSKCLVH